VTLNLSDLIPDANGEVVLFNDSQVRSLELAADSVVVGEGIAENHVTVAQDDVTGFRYLAFANGLTLYYDPNLKIELSPGES